MRKALLFSLLILLTGADKSIQVVDFTELEKHLQQDNKVVVTNFWATWCGPCIRELPHFSEVKEMLGKDSSKVEFVFVSLDFESRKSRAEEVIAKNHLEGKTFLLKDDPNVWINKIDTEWQGNIPYTYITVPGKKSPVKIDKEFKSADELYQIIKKHIK